MKESDFQKDLIKELNDIFPGCLILKNDSGYIQGIPDLTIFYKDKWAMLECKNSRTAKKQNNQNYYVNKADSMSFARFIFPENKKEVIDELKSALGVER